VCTAVAAAILIGEWDEAHEEDKTAVSTIAGADYEAFVRALTPYQTGQSPLISQAGTIWKVYARPTAWRHLEPSLTRKQLEAFLRAAQDVLLEDDPRFDFEPEKRWIANKVRTHSETLRAGLAAGLVHSAVLGRDDSACYAGLRSQSWVDGACRQIFQKRREASFWRRIRGELMQLAEASPNEFLTALGADLTEARPQVFDLFEDEGALGGCLQSDLLWALELLAWSPDHVGHAAMALAALTERDPGGRYGNRPGTSLVHILLPWFPQCNLSAAERVTLFDSIARRHPKAAWAIASALMPANSMISEPTARPKLRDWPAEPRDSMLDAEYWKEIQAISRRLVDTAGIDIGRWEFLLSHLRAFEPALVERVLVEAEALSGRIAAEERFLLWARLRKLLHRHNQFSEEHKVDWVYPREILDRLERIYESLTPADPIARLSWLFSNGVARPCNVASDYAEEQARIEADQTTAIKELARLGFEALVAALPEFQNPRQLGYCLGHYLDAAAIEGQLLKQCANSADQHERDFAQGFAVARHALAPEEFVQRWCRNDSADFLSPRGVATIASALLPTPEVWDLVEAAGPECGMLYWRDTRVLFLKRPRDAEMAARKLLVAHRALDAIGLLSMNVTGAWLAGEGDIRLVVDALEAGVAETNAAPARAQDVVYHMARLIQAIVESKRLQPGAVMHLEWMYFGALEYNAQHKLLIHQHLMSDSVLLLQLVELLYRPEGSADEDRSEPSEREKSLASQAWRILHHWAPFKDASPRSMLDTEELVASIESCRALAATRRHTRVVDNLLGKALASCPPGVDGVWPHESIREVLERYSVVQEIADGFVAGKQNLRGATWRRPGDGGEQEKGLAAGYAEWQRALGLTHPRTSGLLGRLAENYRSDANWQDVLVRQR
jgi:hypothetical protein